MNKWGFRITKNPPDPFSFWCSIYTISAQAIYEHLQKFRYSCARLGGSCTHRGGSFDRRRANRRDPGLRRRSRAGRRLQSHAAQQLHAQRPEGSGISRVEHVRQVAQRRARMGVRRDRLVRGRALHASLQRGQSSGRGRGRLQAAGAVCRAACRRSHVLLRREFRVQLQFEALGREGIHLRGAAHHRLASASGRHHHQSHLRYVV